MSRLGHVLLGGRSQRHCRADAGAQRRLTPDKVRAILMATAKDLGPKGRDVMFGAGLADAYGALMAEQTPVTATPAAGRAREHRRALTPFPHLRSRRKTATCGAERRFTGDEMTLTDPPQMLPLRVTRNDKIADGIIAGIPRHRRQAAAGIFRRRAYHHPGAERVLRKYSLCNDPAERDRYMVAVKREINGRGGSTNLIDNVKAGDELMVAPPVNDFELPQRAQDFLFIAGGIGITPIMAMIREVQRQGKRFRLFYCSRSPETTAFLDELSAPEFKDQVTIHYDQGDPARSLDLKPILAERKNREHLYCCGPRPLMEAVRHMTDHWSSTAVHFEAFSDAETHKADRQAVQGPAGALRRGHRCADDQDHPRSLARSRPRSAEFVRDRHLRHLPHQAHRRRGRSPRPGARRPRARRHHHDLRLARAQRRDHHRPLGITPGSSADRRSPRGHRRREFEFRHGGVAGRDAALEHPCEMIEIEAAAEGAKRQRAGLRLLSVLPIA